MRYVNERYTLKNLPLQNAKVVINDYSDDEEEVEEK
jgi:hypothetical protein